MEANPETPAVNDQAIAEQGASAAAFDRLLAQYRGSARSQREKGNLFEQLVRAYLRLDSQMRLQFARVYAWRDWPGAAGRPDTGIDLVAIEHRDMPSDGEVTPDTPAVAVQCKFYAPQTKIQKEHLDSFLSESGKEPFKRRIFVETTGVAWSQNAEAAIQGQSKPVTRIGLTDLRASNIDWKTYDFATPELSPTLQAHKRALAHQTKAINDVMTGFETHDRGTLVMACGTGKTFTSLQIAQKFAERGDSAGARILFMVPSLALMSQTMHEWAAEVSVPFTAWSVCSDTKVNRKRADRDDIADIATMDLQIPPTTDAASLADSLTQARPNEGLQVVFATYQSIGVIHEAQVLAGEAWRDFDLVICDEAHRTTGAKLANEDESAFTRIHDNTYIRADKRLYMTATPRIFNPAIKKAAREKDAVLSSMDDQAIYGPVFHRLGFGQAVVGGLLTDYKVVVLQVPEDQITSIFQQGDEYGELSIPEAAKLAGCWNALAKRKNSFTDTQYGDDTNPMRRAVAFVKDIKTSKLVATEFQNLVNQHLQNLTNADPSDNLAVQCRHVDGTMNAVQRGEALDWLKAAPGENYPVCRILTNARCLSEGVDVPTLDAVLFLNPRKSFVDVIQAVGRVMRRAPGKRFGYIILPVAIPAGIAPEEALNDNKRFEVVWQVLQAIRAHDERFDATINAIEYNESQPENIIVDVLNFQKPQHPEVIGSGGGCGSDSGEGDTTQTVGTRTDSGTGTARSFQPSMFPASQWKDAVYSKIVKKVGNRLYWDDWSKDIGKIASRYISLIETLLQDEVNSDYFGQFVDALQKTLNPGIDRKQAIDMLAQHLITKPLFDAMFPDQEFTSQNPVSHAMQGILDRLAENQVFETEREPLEKFYQTMTEKIRAIDNLAGKQEIMRTLYDKFFSKAFPKLGDRLGIVFTPVPVVDYILHSAHEALVKHFGKGLGDEGVAIIEPFLGTGTFITRLLQSELISPEQLEHKYRHEIFANEIVLLSYYIASINIEQVYREIRLEQGIDEGYVEFPGITLTDTFQLAERQNQIPCIGDFQANLERVQAQRAAKIQVVVMNPPYSAGQKKANDNNQNLKYPWLDGRIADTYAARSSATNKNSLYDSYYRA
ncbi:helicase C-terminal domain protein, partial [Mobiluncus mulieris ATCC 35239]